MSEEATTGERENWSLGELTAAVAAYREMQTKTRSGESFVKKDYYRKLASQFGRTAGAWEYRMQNISYVLSLQGREWVPGLPPARNVGANVATKLEELLAEAEHRVPAPDVAFQATVQAQLGKGKLKKPEGTKTPKAEPTQTTQFERDPKVAAWVLEQAGADCECCGKPAPFKKADGSPFLEVHHVRRLCDGGSDSVENAVAVCPNCHRELHHGAQRSSLVSRLYECVGRLVRE